MLKNVFEKHPLQNRTNVQIKGGGIKGLLNNVKKTAIFLRDGFPKTTRMCKFWSSTQTMQETHVFWKNLHSWHKFYVTAGREGRDKSQLCILPKSWNGVAILYCPPNIVTTSHLSFLENIRFYKFYNFPSFSLSDSELLMSLFVLSRSHDQLFYCLKFRTNMSSTTD